jgi:hypothetical protein
MSDIKTAITLDSITTTDLTITITNFGEFEGDIGSSADKYMVEFVNISFAGNTYNFEASSNFFTLNVPTSISISDAGWDPAIDPLTVGDNITVEVYNNDKPAIKRSDAEPGTVTAGGGGGGAPCFVAASQLLTPTGYKAAKDIKTGDLLMTADGRQVAVKSFSYTIEKADKDSAPFLISKNSISMGCPNADLKLSPWHAFQMKKGLWMKPMSALELGMPVKQYDLGKSVTYYHFEAPDFFKDNFVCDGTVVESFGGLQTKDFKGRVYSFNANLKGYTRAASKSVNKTIMM